MSTALRCVLMLLVATAGSIAAEPLAMPHVSVLEREVVLAPTVVRVQLDLTIANPLREEREHVLDLHVPESAAVDRFGLWVQGRYLEGEIAPRALGQRLYREVSGIDDPRRVKRDPALLTWEGPGHLRLRVFPVPAQGQAKLRLSYVVLRPLVGPLVIPAALVDAAARAMTVSDTAHTIPALPPPAAQVRVQAFSAKAGEPGYFLAVIPITAWEQPGAVLKPDLELILRDTSRRMVGCYAPGSALQRELASRLTAPHPVFLLDADVVPHEVVALDARSAGSEPSCGGLFDLAAALRAAEVFLANHAGKQVRLTVLGDAEPECGAALAATPVMPQIPGGRLWLSCTSTPSWLRTVAPTLIDERDFTDLQLSGVDGVGDLGPSWRARAIPGEHLLVFGRHNGPQGTIRIRQRAPDGSSLDHSIALTFQPDAAATWLPRLWAVARVRDLAPVVSNPAVAAERERQQQEIASTYQVLSSTTSFVVLSNERDYRANDVERAARVAGWAETAPAELNTEPVASPWQSQSGVGSRMMPPAPEPTGLELRTVWRDLSAQLWLDDNHDLGYAYLSRQGPGIWQNGRVAPVPAPLAMWASHLPAATTIPPAMMALWGERVAAVECEQHGSRWRWWRDGEQAVLQRLAADGQPDWCVVIDGDGVRTALPEWGVWWRHDPANRMINFRLLAIAPSPTWLPLSWLSRHFHLDVTNNGTAQVVSLRSLTNEDPVRGQALSYGFVFSSADSSASVLPLMSWHVEDYSGIHRTTFVANGDEVRAIDDNGEYRQLLRRNTAIDQRLPFPADMMTVGVLDAQPLWQRVRAGMGTPADHWQLALVAQLTAEALSWLERAHAQAPQHPGIALHLAALEHDAGREERARGLLAHLDALSLPAWQQAAFREVRSWMNDSVTEPAEPAPALPVRSYDWPTPWQRQPPRSPDDLAQQVQAAIIAVQPEQFELLARRHTWSGLDNFPTHPLPRTTVLASLFGSEKESAYWPTTAAQDLVTRLERDAAGRRILDQSIHEGGPFIVGYLNHALRDPARIDLARSVIMPTYYTLARNDDGWRRLLVTWSGEAYPTPLRALALTRRLKDFPWSFTAADAARSSIHAQLAAIPQPAVRMRILRDCLGMVGDLYGSPQAAWNALVAARAAIIDPLEHLGAQPELERALVGLVTATVVRHQSSEVLGMIDILRRAVSAHDVEVAYGPLRPLVIQLCRQAAALGERAAATAAAVQLLTDVPEPGLLAALAQAPSRTLALLANDNDQGELAQVTDWQSAPQRWWPEWQEDAATLLQRCLGTGGRPPNERVLAVVEARRLGQGLTQAAVAAFADHAPDLWWLALDTPTDSAAATRSLAALRAVRQNVQCPTFGGVAALRLALLNGRFADARQEVAALLSKTPDHAVLRDFALATAALDGDGRDGETMARAWLAAAPASSVGQLYARIVALLTLTHRYQLAFTLRQEALARFELLRAEQQMTDDERGGWAWLSYTEAKLLNEVVVAPGTVLFPRDHDHPGQEQLKSQGALARYVAVAAAASAGFASATDDQRYAWFSALWIREDDRLGAACPELNTWLQERVAAGAPLPGHLVEAILAAVRPTSAGVWLAYARQSRARGESEMVDRLVRHASHQLSTTQEADVLLAISEFTDTPLPDHHSWMWSATNPPPGLVTRLTTIALEQVRRTLTSAGWISPEQQSWIRAHPEVHRQADALADALMAEQPDDPARLARYAAVGFGSRPAAELWLLLVQDPVASVWPTADYHIAKQVRSACLATLIHQHRWSEVVGLLRLYRRAKVEVEWPRDPPTSDQVLATIVSAGQSETAIALAALSGAGPWLTAHGVADPTTHPDWYPDDADTWILRGDPQRLAAAATALLNDPFANQYDRRQALIWRFAVHLWQGEPSQAQASLDAIVDNDPRVLSGSMSRNLCFMAVYSTAIDAVGQIWHEVSQRVRDDWLTVHGVSDGEWDAPAIAHLTQFDRRCLYFLAYCATAPEAEVSPLALLMALYGGRGGNSDLALQANATTLFDLAEVERRCHRRGLGAAIRDWDDAGGLDINIETPSAGWWPAYAGIWLAHSQATDRPRWPDLAVEAWNNAWVDVPRALQHDILRQVSELALLPRADTWWEQIRTWNSYNDLVQDLLPPEPADPADPQITAPRVDPWAGVIPSPAVWMAREAWWRAPPPSTPPQAP